MEGVGDDRIGVLDQRYEGLGPGGAEIPVRVPVSERPGGKDFQVFPAGSFPGFPPNRGVGEEVIDENVAFSFSGAVRDGFPFSGGEQENGIVQQFPFQSEALQDSQAGGFPDRDPVETGQEIPDKVLGTRLEPAGAETGRVAFPADGCRTEIQVEGRVRSVGQVRIPDLVAAREVQVRLRRGLPQMPV